MKRIKKVVFIILGCLTLGLGTIGVFLPILPTVPFYMVTLFCFANSSEKLHNWFLGTSLYKKHLESFVEHRGMTLKTKLSVIAMVNCPYGIWICHDVSEGDICPLYHSWMRMDFASFIFGTKSKNN